MRKMEYTVYGDVFDAKINPNISQITLVTQLSHVRLERFALHAAKWPGWDSASSLSLVLPCNLPLPLRSHLNGIVCAPRHAASNHVSLV